ncbi:MAG: RNA-binding protein [Pseudomonadota bacterium]
MNIYVGNLSYDVTESDLEETFAAFGQVETVKIIKDMATNKSKGFGFVEMPDKESGQQAIDGMNGKELKGRALKVNEARPRTQDRGDMRRGGGSGGGGGKRGGSSGGGGRRF